MQNKYRSADEAGYVRLSGGWNCPRCGCVNDGCDACGGCGWNRCGCQGGVVYATQTTGGACAREARQEHGCVKTCDDCPDSFVTGHRVQHCPENTRIRRDADCGCTEQYACQARTVKADCGCTEQYACQTRTVKADCGCKEQRACQPRETKQDCGCAEQYACQTCATKVECGCADRSAKEPHSRNAHVGIVHGMKQALADVYESESALRTGTLFPELHKPLNGRCPGCSNCSTCEQQAAFAAWDLRLYLNTHPDDKEALALFRRLREEAQEPSYATTFLEDDCACGWDWTEGPWPWECQPCGD